MCHECCIRGLPQRGYFLYDIATCVRMRVGHRLYMVKFGCNVLQLVHVLLHLVPHLHGSGVQLFNEPLVHNIGFLCLVCLLRDDRRVLRSDLRFLRMRDLEVWLCGLGLCWDALVKLVGHSASSAVRTHHGIVGLGPCILLLPWGIASLPEVAPPCLLTMLHATNQELA